MAFTTLTDWAAKREAEYMAHVRPEFAAWLDSRDVVTYADFTEFCDAHGMNSYERELMIPKLDNAALVHEAEHCLQNCTRPPGKRPGVTYDDQMMAVYVPLLLKRLKSE